MIDCQKQTGKWTVSWRFECTSACGACSSACVPSGSATASGVLQSFYSGPYTFRVGGDDEGAREANLHVSHVLISNSTEATWPTTEELTCSTTSPTTPASTTPPQSSCSRTPPPTSAPSTSTTPAPSTSTTPVPSTSTTQATRTITTPTPTPWQIGHFGNGCTSVCNQEQLHCAADLAWIHSLSSFRINLKHLE